MGELVPDLVTTIIPVYNRPDMVRTAVESVLAQSYRPIEIVLIDDGSTDHTPQVLDRLELEHPGLIRVVHIGNGGPGLAREAGRRLARGEFIQYLDSDDWLLAEKFAVQVRALRDHPECGIAYGVSRVVDDRGNVIEEVSKWTGRRFEYLFPALLLDRWWHTHTPLFRRSLSDAAGPWPKRRPEDWDLEARMGALRTKLCYCDVPVSCQRHHPSAGRVSSGSTEAYLRDEAWFLPRLHECAVRAGIEREAPEMRHFSRWTFMRARHLAARGEIGPAKALLELAATSVGGSDASIRAVSALFRLIGWKATGKLCCWAERLRHSGVASSSPHTTP